MEDGGLATAAYWAPLLETIADIAFAVVIVALAVELVAGRIAKRFEHQIDAAREERIAQLQAIAPRVLSVPAQNVLREKLNQFAPVFATVGTTQPLRHAFDIDSLESQIAGVLALAGWKANAGTTWGTDERPSGVWVSTREGDDVSASAADIFVQELNAAGIVAHRDPKPFARPKPPRPSDPAPLPPGTSGGSIAGTQYRNALSAQREWDYLPGLQVLVGTKP
ncbi:MAG: hypothetical protein WA418_19940 [Bradyrhizobium sp.]